jgi:hypothetical protein
VSRIEQIFPYYIPNKPKKHRPKDLFVFQSSLVFDCTNGFSIWQIQELHCPEGKFLHILYTALPAYWQSPAIPGSSGRVARLAASMK